MTTPAAPDHLDNAQYALWLEQLAQQPPDAAQVADHHVRQIFGLVADALASRHTFSLPADLDLTDADTLDQLTPLVGEAKAKQFLEDARKVLLEGLGTNLQPMHLQDRLQRAVWRMTT